MTIPTQSVQVRRIIYSQLSEPVQPVLYDDLSDGDSTDTLDTVMRFDPSYSIVGYTWNGTFQIPDSQEPDDPIGDALRADAKAYWKMDEASGTRADATGNGHDALEQTANGFMTGKIGNAVFNNTTIPHLYIPNHNDLCVPGAQSFSIAFWFYPSIIPTDGNLLATKAGINQDIQYELDFKNDSCIWFYIAGVDISYPTVISDTLSPGQWYFVDAEFEAGVGLSLRINNSAPVTQAYVLDNIESDVTDLALCHVATTDGAIGMDEMLFIKRLSTPAERDYLYNSGNGRTLYP